MVFRTFPRSWVSTQSANPLELASDQGMTKLIRWMKNVYVPPLCLDPSFVDCYKDNGMRCDISPEVELRVDPVDRYSRHMSVCYGAAMKMPGDPLDMEECPPSFRVSTHKAMKCFICPISTPDGARSRFKVMPTRDVCVSRMSNDVR